MQEELNCQPRCTEVLGVNCAGGERNYTHKAESGRRREGKGSKWGVIPTGLFERTGMVMGKGRRKEYRHKA